LRKEGSVAMASGAIWKEGLNYGRDRLKKVWVNLGKNSLWKRMVKNIIATTAAGKPGLGLFFGKE